MISWVVPTVTGREEGLERSLLPLEGRKDVQVIVIENEPTCGKAWVDGFRLSSCNYVYFAADDIEPHDGFIEAMCEAIDDGKHPAARVLLPGGSQQSCGGAGSDVCRANCEDWTPVEWSPTPFIHRDWWEFIEPHAEMLEKLHYSSDRLVSAALAKHGIQSVFRGEAKLTHYNDLPGRLYTAGGDSSNFESYWAGVA